MAGLLLAACGSSPSSSGGGSGSPLPTPAPTSTSTSAATPSGSAGQFLSTNAGAKSVTLTLNIEGFNFDGFNKGQMTVNVPEGWSVTVQCSNKTSIPHSCAILQSTSATTPVFSGAATADPTSGLQPGSSQSFTFTASQTGQFVIACLVPGHAAGGMWDHFNVTSGGSPSISA